MIADVTALMVDKSNVNTEQWWNNVYREENPVIIPHFSPQIPHALS